MSQARATNVFLVGPMGSGKSSVGRCLAGMLGRTFKDSDTELERQTGVTVSVIFEYEGEAGFRRREHHMLERLTAEHGLVLATGGGAVLDPANRALLKARGVVVYLNAGIDDLLRRTARDTSRPLLNDGSDRRETLERLLRDREPLYREVADQVVETGAKSMREVARELAASLEAPCRP